MFQDYVEQLAMPDSELGSCFGRLTLEYIGTAFWSEALLAVRGQLQSIRLVFHLRA